MWWTSSMPKHLPRSLGPIAPGCMDVMTGYGPESLFFRIYYPSSSPKNQNDHNKWVNWSPRDEYIDGLARIANAWGSAIKALVWLYGGEPKVPVMWEAQPRTKKMPVALFSHGFGATRFLSSTTGYELASWGHFVVSIEHKDTSACTTYYYENKEKQEKDEPVWIKHIKMSEVGKDGRPHYTIRNEQVHKRADEVKRVLDFLEKLNIGEGTNILPSSLNLDCFKGLLDMSSVSLMGHSFGGATTLLTMANENRITAGILFDVWMFPVKEEKLEIRKPLLFINTQTFHITSNIDAIDKVMENNYDNDRKMFTIKHTTHETQTDMPFIIGYWLNWFMYKIPPEIGGKINNSLTLAFLHKHLGVPDSDVMFNEYLKEQKNNYIEGSMIYTKVPARPNKL